MSKHISNRIETPDLTITVTQGITPVLRPRIPSSELFGTAHEIVIEHAGEEYRLRLTRKGKLILTK